jgi:vacuolar iron transporter family protein
MPTTPHIERHFTATQTVRNIVIGMADGLTVPFALAAGLSGTVGSLSLIVIAGLAEIAAGAVAMGLGGYLAAKTDSQHYTTEQRRELHETQEIPTQELEEVAKVFRGHGLSEEQSAPLVAAIAANRARWVDFMMRFELGLQTPNPSRAQRDALTIGASYIVGGLIPLAPYILLRTVQTALWGSVGVTLTALFIFGYVKGRLTEVNPPVVDCKLFWLADLQRQQPLSSLG